MTRPDPSIGRTFSGALIGIPHPGFGNARAAAPGRPSRDIAAGCHALSTPSNGTFHALSRSLRERMRRSNVSISITRPILIIVPTTTERAMLSTILGLDGLLGATAALSTATLVWFAWLSTWLTT